MTDQLEKVIRPIVEGQIRSFIADHPGMLKSVDWYRPRDDKATTLTNSIAKRIIRDLLCEQTRVRLVAALVADSTASAAEGEPANRSMGCHTT